MSLRISFELSAKDVKHFRAALRKARDTARDAKDEEIIDAARASFAAVGAGRVPNYIGERIDRLKAMADMIEDREWPMNATEKDRVLSALVYFSDPDDMIPDDIPGIGFLDDAIMIELAFRELKHEIEAYQDFCEYRRKYDAGFRLRRNADKRAQKLAARRTQLRERAQRRRERDRLEGGQPKLL